jgi:hypothetical protein
MGHSPLQPGYWLMLNSFIAFNVFFNGLPSLFSRKKMMNKTPSAGINPMNRKIESAEE